MGNMKEYKHQWYLKNKEKILQKMKLKMQDPEYKKLHKKYVLNYKSKNRKKINQKSREVHQRYLKAKNRAKRNNVEFTLSEQEFSTEIENPCYYCNNLLGKPSVVGVGLDRIDPKFGYILGNVKSCCSFCNSKKSNDLTSEETLSIMKLLIQMRSLNTTPIT